MNIRLRDEMLTVLLLLAAACICCTPFGDRADLAPYPRLTAATPLALDPTWSGASALAAVSRVPSDIDPTPAPVLSPEPGAECGHCNRTRRSKPDGNKIKCLDGGSDCELSEAELGFLNQHWQTTLLPLAEPGSIRKPEPELAELETTPAKKPSVVQERSLLAPQPASLGDAHPSRPVQAAAPSLSADHDAPPFCWLSSLDEGRQASRRTNRPALVYWYGENCPPCRALWRSVLLDQDVQELLKRNFVCVKINTDRMNRTPAGQQQLTAWKIDSIPQVFLVRPDWKTSIQLNRTNEPRDFIEQLNAGQEWSARQVRTKLAARMSQRVPIRLAVLRSAPAAATDHAMPESIPLETIEEVWQPTRVRVQQVQYTLSPSYGSTGGSGAFRFVVPNGGAHGINGGSYPAANGWWGGSPAVSGYYRQPAYYQPPMDRQPAYYGGYGSPSASTAYGGYYAQSSHFQPRMYYAPSYYGNQYAHPPAVVCGPYGCFLQR